uniref:Uncharacterized protein n=1 Tax=Steinernema glaseri TaxID=37863 RepID=A0A1I7ZK82_9BILA
MRINHTLSPSFGIDGRFVEFSVSRLRPPSCPAASTTATAVGAERGIDGGQPYFLGAHVYCFLYSIMCLLSIHTTPIKEVRISFIRPITTIHSLGVTVVSTITVSMSFCSFRFLALQKAALLFAASSPSQAHNDDGI